MMNSLGMLFQVYFLRVGPDTTGLDWNGCGLWAVGRERELWVCEWKDASRLWNMRVR